MYYYLSLSFSHLYHRSSVLEIYRGNGGAGSGSLTRGLNRRSCSKTYHAGSGVRVGNFTHANCTLPLGACHHAYHSNHVAPLVVGNDSLPSGLNRSIAGMSYGTGTSSFLMETGMSGSLNVVASVAVVLQGVPP